MANPSCGDCPVYRQTMPGKGTADTLPDYADPRVLDTVGFVGNGSIDTYRFHSTSWYALDVPYEKHHSEPDHGHAGMQTDPAWQWQSRLIA